MWAPLSRHAHRLLTEPRAQAAARPGLGSIAIYASCEIPASALPPARFHLTRDFSIRRSFRRISILFRGTDRVQVERSKFHTEFTPLDMNCERKRSPTYFQIASARRYNGHP